MGGRSPKGAAPDALRGLILATGNRDRRPTVTRPPARTDAPAIARYAAPGDTHSLGELRGTPTAIRLLVLGGSLDQTETITTSLRNGGLAVHSTRLTSSDALEEALRTQAHDLLLCCAFDLAIDLHRTLVTITELERDLPLLVVFDGLVEPSRLLQAMREGARDLVDRENLDHLQLVVAREFGDLQQRRELAALRSRLQESEQRCLGLIEGSREPIAFFQDGMHIHVNPAYLQLLGFESRADVEDLPLLDVIHKSYHRAVRMALKSLDADAERRTTTLDAACHRQDGSTIDATLVIAKAGMEGESGLQVIIRRRSYGDQELDQPADQLAYLDAKTELPSREQFLSQLDDLPASRAGDDDLRALVLLAIDNFPKLRSRLGAHHADALVHRTADCLRDSIGPQDLLARFSGSTFALLCRRPDIPALERLAESLRRAVAEMAPVDGAPPVTCSLGLAYLDRAQADLRPVLDRVQGACEAAQEEGGNRVVLVRPDSTDRPEMDAKDGKILQQIDEALRQDRLRLVYQPIVSLQGDSRESYAVMVRILDDQGAPLLPTAFLRQAEQYGKMVEIDRWVIRNAIAALSAQRRQGRKVIFFLSLSEAAILDKHLLLWICDCLREQEARGGWLSFQIREEHARRNLQAVATLIDGLRKIRCQIAIDHFGLLPEPAALLDRLEIDYVKLAPSFVSGLSSSQQKQDQLNSLHQLLLAHGVKTVATAVEEANSLTVLWTAGIAYIQGYFLQGPSDSIDYDAQPSP
jgi:multidomain signaling protein FimX